jgi:Phage Tail Collar Domain
MAVLFNGDFANPTTPLWLSALTPVVAPSNLQVTTLSVAANGGIVLGNNNQLYPNNDGAPVSFSRGFNASFDTQLQQINSKNVPTKVVESQYVTATTSGGAVFDDMAMQGLQIYGPQVTAPAGNQGCAGYLTRGAQPFSVELYTGNFTTPIINASASITTPSISTTNVSATNINATNAVFSTLNVSTGNFVIPDPLTVSTLIARQGFISSVNADQITTSTLSAQNFVLPNSIGFSTITASTVTSGAVGSGVGNFSTLNVSTLNAQNLVLPGNVGLNNITASTITAGIGNFSTLNAPSANIAVSTVGASTVTTGVLSTTTGVIKEVFASTMVLNASVSPKLDLGLGGIIGGLIGGFGGNALSVGLGASALGTGIAALTMSRTSGGINPNIYQTVNGTTQLQFSTLGAVSSNIFVGTDSVTPNTTPGNITSNTTFIPAGALVVRSVSDPLNLPNASGAAGQGIQGFSQWAPVFPGYVQVQNNQVTSLLSGNSINLGNSLGDGINIVTAGGGRSTRVNGTFIASTMISNGPVTAPILNALSYVSTPAITNGTTPISISPGLTTSTIAVSSFSVGNTVTAAIQTGTLGVTGVTNLVGAVNTGGNLTVGNTLTVENAVTLSRAGAGGQGVVIGNSTGTPLDGNSLIVTNNIYAKGIVVGIGNISATEINNLVAINGQPYPPIAPGGGVPVGTVMMYAGANAPGGFLICDGSSYAPATYPALYGAISTAYGGTPGANFNVPDLRTKTVFGASGPGFQGDTTPWPSPMVAMSFSALQTLYSGTVVPNGTNPNGRGALAVTSIPVGYELQVGMRVQAQAPQIDQSVHVIVQILNYNGNGGSYTNPNFPVLIINPPLSADTTNNAQWTVTPVGPYSYTIGQSSTDNYYTQASTDVPAHTHGNKKGGINAPIDTLENNASGNPTNNSDQITQGVTTNYYYAVGSSTLGQPATVFNIGTSMYTRPSMVCMNYIIKY